MKKLLIVDDDNAMRSMFRMRLSDSYEIFDTGDAEQALALALEHKPDAILLDLMMPKFSGFELCQNFRALSYTAYVPIFVISGESGLKYKEYCGSLGAAGYFEKPIDFAKLKEKLAEELMSDFSDRRAEVRIRMRVPLKLRGQDTSGQRFEELCETENVTTDGFLSTCTRPLQEGSMVEVFLSGEGERFAGKARVVRKEESRDQVTRYGFQFEEKTSNWVLHKA